MAVSSGLLQPQEAEQGLEDLATSLNNILSLKVCAPIMFCMDVFEEFYRARICYKGSFLDLERLFPVNFICVVEFSLFYC
jgi:hypothetical protein